MQLRGLCNHEHAHLHLHLQLWQSWIWFSSPIHLLATVMRKGVPGRERANSHHLQQSWSRTLRENWMVRIQSPGQLGSRSRVAVQGARERERARRRLEGLYQFLLYLLLIPSRTLSHPLAPAIDIEFAQPHTIICLE